MFRAKLLTCLIMAAAFLGLGVPEASAFSVPANPAIEIAAAVPAPLIDVRHGGGGHGSYHGNNWNHGHWNNRYYGHRYYGHRYYGNRCRSWANNCRYYYNGWYYPNIWWSAPVIGFGFAVNNYNSYSSRHVRWCSQHYRSYNPRNNTWVSNSGKVRQCVSPYGG